MTTKSGAASCELCEAARMTTWFYEDDVCWIADCEFCGVPMVVWRVHAVTPPDSIRTIMHARLDEVARQQLGSDFFVDDQMRNIPEHYHAHARPRPRWAARRSPAPESHGVGGASEVSRGER